ncbi:hypothetical protein FVD69_14540, partial [Enterococcus faecium]|nr:hypothetical protein [Enterococcus faecium]
MNDFTTEIVQTLVTKGDLNELFRSHLEKAINTLLPVSYTHRTLPTNREEENQTETQQEKRKKDEK